jgi:glucose/arabinose dehydrogenase
MLVAVMVLGFGAEHRLWSAEAKPADPLQDWAVQEGYSLKIAASGFSLPTAIAAVPNPKPDPKSPRLFVTELRGTVKAVANDGSVRELARVETFQPAIEWPDSAGEGGMAGICLAPDQGYVFVTYTYRDKYGVLRNGISRFTTEPQTFDGTAAERRDYWGLFEGDTSALAHQIGGCVVRGDSVYVSVGDGGDPAASRSLDKMLGKILRLTLDGSPYPGNPFADSGGRAAAVYAYGLRNPFGVAVVDGRVFSAENGVAIDRFLEIRAGTDYAWDGTDGSITTNAAAVFSPTICPVQVAFAPEDQSVLQPRPNPRFLIAVSEEGEKDHRPGVMSVEYDLDRDMVVGTPAFLVRLEATRKGQGVVGVALSGDGLYFVPILPVGSTGVLMRMRYEPERAHSRILGRGTGPAALIQTFQCLKCHSLNGLGGTQGPALDKNSLTTRVQSRVNDPSYDDLIAKLEAIPDKTIQATSPARKEVLAADGKERMRLWIVNRLLFPKFDAPNAQMPQMNMTREQAEAITLYLLRQSPARHPLRPLWSRTFIAGTGFGLATGVGFAMLFAKRARRRSARDRSTS